MPMLQQMTWRGPTDEEMKLVKEVYTQTGILTVKDAKTGHPAARPYGVEYQPRASQHLKDATMNGPSTAAFSDDTVHVRSVQIELAGTAKFPNGIAIGGVEVWVRDVALAMGGGPFSVTKFLRDISTAEFDRLKSWAEDVPWVTNESIAAEDKRAAQLRRHQTETQQDPVGVVARAIGDALKSAVPAPAPAAPAVSPQMPTVEQLRAAGFVQDGAGTWHLLNSKVKDGVKS